MRKRILLFFFWGSIACVLPAQDAQVFYNLFNDSVYYVQNGQSVKHLKIRRGDRVLLHFTEFNPYLYEATVKVEQSDSHDWNGGSGMGAFQSLVPGIAGLIPGMSALMGGAGAAPDTTAGLNFKEIPLLHLGEATIRFKDLFSNARASDAALTEARKNLEELVEQQQDMEDIYLHIKALEKTQMVAELAIANLDKLPYNPRLKPSVIQKMCGQYFEAVFQKAPGNDTASLDDILKWGELPAEKQRLLQQLGSKQREFKSKSLELVPLTKDLDQTQFDSPAFSNFVHELGSVQGQAQQLDQQISAYLQRQRSGTPRLSAQQIVELQTHFLELLNTPFAYESAVQLEKETAFVEATFTPRDTALLRKHGIGTAPKTKFLEINTRGGIKINASIGVGFGSFFDAAEEFGIRDNQITVQQLGAFQPSITSYIHFYPNTHGDVALAGSFGIGFPLGNLDAQSINFCLGPSLIFGKGQRIVFSTGLMGGQVSRLAKGYQPGDAFDLNNGDIPTRKRYEMGYFVGVSFNVGGK